MESYTWWDRFKAELKSFTGDAGGKTMVFMLVLGILGVLFAFWALSLL